MSTDRNLDVGTDPNNPHNNIQQPEDIPSDDDEVFQNRNNEGDTTIPRPRGGPPGPKVAKLHQEIVEANTTIKEQQESIDQLKLDLEITQNHLELLQQQDDRTNQNLVEQQATQIESKDNEITALTDSITKQDNKIMQLTKQNLKLKTANTNLLERLANHELTMATTKKTQKNPPPNIIMIGDSNGKRLQPALSTNQNISITLHQSSTIQKTLTDLKAQKFPNKWTDAQAILIVQGTNDIQNGTKARDSFTTIANLAETINQHGKKTIICEIPPFNEDTNLDMEASIHNCLLATLPSTSPNITIIKYRDEIDELIDQTTFTDHVHLNIESQAAKHIVEKISQHLTTMDWTPTPNQSQTINLPPQTSTNQTADYPIPRQPTSTTQPKETSTNQRPYTRTLSVPKDKAGIIIGMKQTGINKLKTTYNVNLNYISQKDADVVFKITGTMTNVIQTEEEMKRLVLSKINAPPPNRNPTTSNRTYNPPTPECDCPDCNRQTTQCRNPQRSIPTTPSWADQLRQPLPTPAWPELPQQDWSQSPACKRSKINH